MQNKTMLSNKTAKAVHLYSIILALYAGIWTITTMFLMVSPTFQNVMSSLYLGLAFIWVGLTLFTGGRYLRMSKAALMMLVVCASAYFLTIQFSVYRTSVTFLIFTCVTLLAILFIQVEINTRTFLLTSMIVPIIGLPYIPTLISLVGQEDELGMGTSYAFLLPAISTIVYFLKYLGQDTRFNKFLIFVLVAINLIYIILIISSGSRGVVLSIVLTILSLYLMPYDDSNQGVRIKKTRIVVFLIIAIIILNYFWDILEWLVSVLNGIGLSFYALDRTIEFHKVGNVLTGRDVIMEKAWTGICESPFLGHGIGTFSDYVNATIPYIHNSVYQLLFDGGIVLFLLVLYPLFVSIKHWVSKCSYRDYPLMVTLFGASVPGSLFSHDLWNLPILWMFIGYSLRFFKNKV